MLVKVFPDTFGVRATCLDGSAYLDPLTSSLLISCLMEDSAAMCTVARCQCIYPVPRTWPSLSVYRGSSSRPVLTRSHADDMLRTNMAVVGDSFGLYSVHRLTNIGCKKK